MIDLPKIARVNIRVYNIAEFCRALVFTIPIWIAFLQSRISVSQVSLYVAVVFMTQFLMELPTGAFADLVGKKVTIILAYLVDGVQYLLLLLATNFQQFLVLAIISGLAEALRSGSLEAMVYDSLKQDGEEKNFRSVMAKQSIYFQVGLIIASVVGGFFATISMAIPFALTGGLCLVAGITSFWFVEPVVDSKKFTIRNYLHQIKWGVREAFKSSAHKYMSLYYIAVGSISWMCATYFNDFILIDLGFSPEWRGVIAGGLRIINITLLARLLTNERLFSFRNTIIFFPILMAIGLLPGQLLYGWVGVPFLGMVMMSSTARWILLGKYTNMIFESKYRATAISTLSMGIGIVYVGVVTLSGPIMERWGDTRLIYSLLGVLSLLTIPPLAYKILNNNVFEK